MIDQYFGSNIRNVLVDASHNTKKKFVDYYIKTNNQQSWTNSYNNIKDATWPECNSFQEFYNLPEYIQQECKHQHQFCPETFVNRLALEAEQQFDQSLTVQKQKPELEQVLLNNLHIIKDKKVIDFACNDGRWSVFSLLHQCADIVGVDARHENVATATAIKNSSFESDNNINFILGDIHNTSNNQQLCAGRDTVFLFGIMYHVYNHNKIIQSICCPSVKHVVIESKVIESITPTVEWIIEPTHNRGLAWDSNNTELLIGIPSVAFFDLVFEQLGYKKTLEQRYVRQMSDPNRNRAILLYEK